MDLSSVRPRRALIRIGIIGILAVLSSDRIEKTAWRLRYRYPRRHPLIYRIRLDGEGEIDLGSGKTEGDIDGLIFPVIARGGFDLKITAADAEGSLTALKISPENFNFELVNSLRGEEITLLLRDQFLEIRRGSDLLKKISAGQAGFPLNDIVGARFDMTVDDRGKVIRAKFPPPPPGWPYLKFDGLLEKLRPEFPEDTVRKGESWTRALEVIMPAAGRLEHGDDAWKLEMKYTFRGLKNMIGQIAEIEVEGRASRTVRPGGKDSPADGSRSFQQDISGRIDFDLERGVVVLARISLSQRVNSRLSIDEWESGKSVNLLSEFEMNISEELQDEIGEKETSPPRSE